MKRRIADLSIEVRAAEREKFAAPLLLLHGLWTGPWVWNNFAGYLSHRGWTSCVVDLHSFPEESSGRELFASINRLASQLDSPPIAIGHDTGGTLALCLENVRAAVALAPWPLGTANHISPVLSSLRGRLARSLGRSFRPSRRQASRWLGVESHLLLVPERAERLNELAAAESCGAARHPLPRLVIAGEDDRLAARSDIEQMAADLGADFSAQKEAGHALPFGPSWEALVSEVHRWIIRQLGDSLLLLRGDEDLRDD